MSARVIGMVASQLGRRGFEVRRHPATRRQKILSAIGVDLVLDVGASTGGYGRSLREFGYTGNIVSFEPLNSAFAELSDHIRQDSKWTAINSALGAEAGESTINIASNSASSSFLDMLEAHIDAAPQVRYVDSQTVRVSTLDHEASLLDVSGNSTFLKIDTQGFEREVLAGGGATVAAVVGLQLELSFVPLYAGGMLANEAISWAYEHGFHLVGVEQGYAAPSGEILQIDGIFIRNEAQ